MNKIIYKTITIPRKGFTLAEVLITLAVIGVVATMSIPALVANTDKQEYVTGLKKFISVGTQALQKMAADYGCNYNLACTGLIGIPEATDAAFGDALTKVMSVSKNCGPSSYKKCWATPTSRYYDTDSPDYDIDGTVYGVPPSSNSYKFITADGMSVFPIISSQISSNSVSNTPPMNEAVGHLFVDVNGLKGPNRFGRDVFDLQITNSGILVPTFTDDYKWSGGNWKNQNHCNPKGVGDAMGCAARIIEEGWQMNY